MDKYDKRLSALKGLIDSLGRGGIAMVAARIGKEPNYVSRMLYPPGKKGRKRIGEDSLDALASAYPEWFGNIQIDIAYEKPSPQSTKKVMEPTPGSANASEEKVLAAYDRATPQTKAVVDAILGVGEPPPWFDCSAAGFIEMLKCNAGKWIGEKKTMPQRKNNAAAA